MSDLQLSVPPNSSMFVTHARTLEELRAEFLSDLHRRLHSLDTEARYEKQVGKSLAIARAKMELEGVLRFWQEVELKGMARVSRNG